MRAKRQRLRSAPPPSEDHLLVRIREALSASERGGSLPLRLAIGDDAAIVRPRSGYETILTCDWFLESTHFLLDRHPPDSIGWKSLARAASDLAAMGAEPRCFLLSLAIPSEATGLWLNEFLRGLRAASRQLKCPAAGGDTTRRDQILVHMTVVGECLRGRAILRDGAKAGDAIFVTGRLGQAELGLQLIRDRKGGAKKRDARLQKQLYPQPRLTIGSWLARERLATAMMDLSDGLSSDLERMCQASRVGARIEAGRIPCPRLSSLDAKKFNALELALNGGDDYELLFTVAPRNISLIPRSIAGTSLTLIGHIVPETNVLLITEGRREIPLAKKGWDPFRA